MKMVLLLGSFQKALEHLENPNDCFEISKRNNDLSYNFVSLYDINDAMTCLKI